MSPGKLPTAALYVYVHLMMPILCPLTLSAGFVCPTLDWFNFLIMIATWCEEPSSYYSRCTRTPEEDSYRL